MPAILRRDRGPAGGETRARIIAGETASAEEGAIALPGMTATAHAVSPAAPAIALRGWRASFDTLPCSKQAS